METVRAYYEHTGGDPAGARIREIRPLGDRIGVILDRTIFYPEGGGQSGDRGTINGFPLADVQEKNGEILHLLDAAAGLSPGPAELRLDHIRRRDLTVHHTAQHLLSGTILRLTGSPTVSMRLGEEVCTVDVDTPALSPETLIDVEEAVQDAVEADVPVCIHLCPPEDIGDFPLRKVPPRGEEVIRVVEITGRDFSPCCGTHLSSTGGIGVLRILGAEKYKGMTRLTFIAGRRALRDSRMLRTNGETISRALKVPVAETGKGVLALLERTGRLERDLKAREEENAQYRAEKLLREGGHPEKNGCSGKLIRFVFPDLGMDEALRIGRAAQKMSGALVVTVSTRDLQFAALCSPQTYDLRALLGGPLAAHKGRGGGGPLFFQGAFPSETDMAAFLDQLPRIAEAGGKQPALAPNQGIGVYSQELRNY
jgi:alanyl-tRNA synthetase